MNGPTLLLVGLLLAGGPKSQPPTTTLPASRDPYVERVVFDTRDGRSLEGLQEVLPETTPPRTGFVLYERLPGRSRKIAERVGAAAYSPEGMILFVQGDSLFELDALAPRLVARGVAPDFALSPSGDAIAVVRPDGPGGGTAIDLLPRLGGKGRRLVAPVGTNGMPVFAPDGKSLVFMSTRSGIASFFRVERSGEGLRQLTNIGIEAGPGGFGPGFVPPAESRQGLRFVAPRSLEYPGAGALWRLEIEDGAARRVAGGGR